MGGELRSGPGAGRAWCRPRRRPASPGDELRGGKGACRCSLGTRIEFSSHPPRFDGPATSQLAPARTQHDPATTKHA